MWFVYLSIAWFALWIGLRVEHYPFGLLTMIVSLEAIFLSTFVMISQNRADERRQVLADNQWTIVQTEEAQNEQLIELSTQILQLTKAIHALTVAKADDAGSRATRHIVVTISPQGGVKDPIPGIRAIRRAISSSDTPRAEKASVGT